MGAIIRPFATGRIDFRNFLDLYGNLLGKAGVEALRTPAFWRAEAPIRGKTGSRRARGRDETRRRLPREPADGRASTNGSSEVHAAAIARARAGPSRRRGGDLGHAGGQL